MDEAVDLADLTDSVEDGAGWMDVGDEIDDAGVDGTELSGVMFALASIDSFLGIYATLSLKETLRSLPRLLAEARFERVKLESEPLVFSKMPVSTIGSDGVVGGVEEADES